jgi:deoxyadenosine/deoxycytidine kinase
MKYRYICIEGVIGAGKTSLAKQLATDLDSRLILEQFEDNPFLPKFYEEPDKYAFPLELSFLASRFQQLKEKLSLMDMFQPAVVSDYFIQKSLIFARNTLGGDELNLYQRLFHIMADILPVPDLLLYLHLPVRSLQDNIRKRGRGYEQKISDAYLNSLQEGYLDYIRQHPHQRILVLDTSSLDFVNKAADYQRICGYLSEEWSPGIHYLDPKQ